MVDVFCSFLVLVLDFSGPQSRFGDKLLPLVLKLEWFESDKGAAEKNGNPNRIRGAYGSIAFALERYRKDFDGAAAAFQQILDNNFFRGQSKDFKTGQVYGGQVLGQAIKAAYETVDNDRLIHSAHAYFLKRGDVDAPIIYEVDRSLDGGSFSSRRVVAIQHGRQIFHLSASFQKKEEGLEHHRKWVPPIDTLHSALEQKIPSNHGLRVIFCDRHQWYNLAFERYKN